MPDTWNDEDDDGSPTADKETKKAGFFGWGKKRSEGQREITDGDNFHDEPINGSSQPGEWFGRKNRKTTIPTLTMTKASAMHTTVHMISWILNAPVQSIAVRQPMESLGMLIAKVLRGGLRMKRRRNEKLLLA